MVLYDVVREIGKRESAGSRAEFYKELERLAFDQIPQLAIFNTLQEMSPESIGLKKKDLRDKSSQEISKLTSHKISELISSLSDFDEEKWQVTFIAHVEKMQFLVFKMNGAKTGHPKATAKNCLLPFIKNIS